MLSAFANHNYQFDKESNTYMESLIAFYQTYPMPRTQSWIEQCHWIWAGDDITNGYLDCYYVVIHGGGPGGDPIFDVTIPKNTTNPKNGGGGNEVPPTDETGTGEINIDLDEDCLRNIGVTMLEQIKEEYKNVEFPCDENSKDDILSEYLTELCKDDPRIDLNDLKDVLKEVDKIRNNFTDKRLSCIYDKLITDNDQII